MSGIRRALWAAGGTAALVSTLFAFQMPFREYPGIEYNDFPLPADAHDKAEFMFARLMYPQDPGARGFNAGGFRGGGGTGSTAIPCGPRITRAPTAIFCWRCGG